MTNPSLRRALLLSVLLVVAVGVRADDARPKCYYVKVATLPIRYLSESFDPAVEGVINGAPARMLLDTGANASYLTRSATDRLNLPLYPTRKNINGVGGASRVYFARVQDFSVGPAHSGKANFLVIGDTGGKIAYDAIVGADFLLQADMEISLAEKQIRFFRPKDCGESFLAYWSSDAIEIPFTGDFGDSLNQVFTVELNGKKMNAVIDSGAPHSVVFINAARKAGIDTSAPGVLKGHDAFGIGSDRVTRWTAVFDSFAIGSETIRRAEIDILDMPSSGRIGADILLGADFLRAHRVLFAMSQQRLYISYLGGAVFTREHQGIEPWLQQEADAGNPDAQYLLALTYQNGNGVDKDTAQAVAWLAKAAGQGHPRANLMVGHNLLLARQFPAAAERLRGALDKLPDERTGALWLYLARLQSGDATSAAGELAAIFGADKERRWPSPIADYYLGRIGSDALLAKAAKEAGPPLAPTCEAAYYIAELHRAKGEIAEARSLIDATRADCARR